MKCENRTLSCPVPCQSSIGFIRDVNLQIKWQKLKISMARSKASFFPRQQPFVIPKGSNLKAGCKQAIGDI